MTPLLIIAFLVMLAAAAAQTITGFGFALVSVPLITLIADPRAAVVGITLAALALTITGAVRERQHASWGAAAGLIGAAILGMPVGLLVLEVAPERVLAGLIGVAVIACAVLIWRGLRLPDRWPVVLGVGILAGTMSTSTGTNGPPLVAAFQAMGYPPRRFRATLAVTFGGTAIASTVGFLVAGQVTGDALWIGLLGAPAVLLGWWVGNRWFHRIPSARFRGIVLTALMISGASVSVTALGAG